MYINMHPDAVPLTDVRNVIDGVKGSDDGGAGRAVDKEGLETPGLVLGDEPLQVSGAHPASGVHSDLATVISAKTQGGRRAFDGVVALKSHHELSLFIVKTLYMFAGVEDRPLGQPHHAGLLVAGEVLVAGDDEGVHVADAPPGGQDAVTLGPADDLPHLEQHLVLHHDEHGRDLVCKHVGIGGGRQPLARHAHDVQALGKLVEEVRVARLDLVAKGSAAV